MLDKKDLILVSGAGGFIGGHLVADLLRQGYERVRAVDIKPFQNWYQWFSQVENIQRDLRDKSACHEVTESALTGRARRPAARRSRQ